MMKVVLVLTFLLSQFGLARIEANEEAPETRTDDPCAQHKKCFHCIQTWGCGWCQDKNWPLEQRCFGNHSQASECSRLVNPKGTMEEDRPSSSERNLKILPQVVQLRLRKGEKMNISIHYTNEENRPLDLYIVMDLSFSMKRHKDKVAALAASLEANLKNLTSNLTMGFGSFVDKPLAPFGFLASKKPYSPSDSECGKDDIKCAPYGFRNHLTLTENITVFSKGVESAGISSNVDDPEGTLEALVQSIVCKDKIGWRNLKGSRKVIVVSTDAGFHLAGDGKLVGVALPHDGRCYVDSTGMYTHSTILDYPSLSLLRQRIRDNDVTVIFAVTNRVMHTYTELSNQLQPSAVTRAIDNEGSIITVIQEEYKKIVNTVALLHELESKDNLGIVGIKYYVLCPGSTEYVSGDRCDAVEARARVDYKVEVELKDCPANRELWRTSVKIRPQSSSDDYTTLSLTMLCDCDCELKSEQQRPNISPKSAECSGNGNLQCGICYCDENWGGPHCKCTTNEHGLVDTSKCKDERGIVCSNRGTCDSCGQCKCNSNIYSGQYCQCENADCPRREEDAGLCNENAVGGPHGHCKCSPSGSFCLCLSGFNGTRCECPTSDETCHDAKSSAICNGFGSCQCGKCVCETAHTGDYCEIQHATKIDGSCETALGKVEKCVKCLVSTTGDKEPDGARRKCEDECLKTVIISTRVEQVPDHEIENVCPSTLEDSNGCRVDFLVRGRDIRNNSLLLEIELRRDAILAKCPTPVPIFGIVTGIIGAVILIGVVLLFLWKIVTHIQDKQEYERFQKYINAAAWDIQENPLYHPSTSQFKNPAYVNFEEAESQIH